jgi:4-hydroxybenzoate polyprenyltransferase
MGKLITILVSTFKLASKFVRVKIITTCYLIVFLGSLSAGSVTLKTLFALALLIAWYIHASSSNDYADRMTDGVNLAGAKDRPFVTKKYPFKKIVTIHIAAGVLTLLLSILYGPYAILFSFILLMLNYAYSFRPFRIMDKGALAQLMLPIAYVVYPFSLGFWSSDMNGHYPIVLIAGLYAGFVARLFLKDFRDIKGDMKFNKRTFLIRHGRMMTCNASLLFGSISLILLVLATEFSNGVLFVLILGHIGVVILLRKLSAESRIKKQMRLVALLARIGNASVVTLIVYYLCKMYGVSPVLEIAFPALIGLVLLKIFKDYKDNAQTQSA